MHPQMLTIEIT